MRKVPLLARPCIAVLRPLVHFSVLYSRLTSILPLELCTLCICERCQRPSISLFVNSTIVGPISGPLTALGK